MPYSTSETIFFSRGIYTLDVNTTHHPTFMDRRTEFSGKAILEDDIPLRVTLMFPDAETAKLLRPVIDYLREQDKAEAGERDPQNTFRLDDDGRYVEIRAVSMEKLQRDMQRLCSLISDFIEQLQDDPEIDNDVYVEPLQSVFTHLEEQFADINQRIAAEIDPYSTHITLCRHPQIEGENGRNEASVDNGGGMNPVQRFIMGMAARLTGLAISDTGRIEQMDQQQQDDYTRFSK